MALPKMIGNVVALGCDPEFFLKNKIGSIVGAEHVIPDVGLKANKSDPQPMVIADGVAVELNPWATTCRDGLAGNIAYAFRALDAAIKESKKGLSASPKISVTLTKAQHSKLSEANRVLGCSPSFNAYGDTTSSLKDINAMNHLERSAGGHIHFGIQHKAITEDAATVVKILDIICGNTCVLIDRDEGNAVRRKMYGLAGEYRLPKHGLEYRTLSNFWLVNHSVYSFAFGMARLAIDIATDMNREAYAKALFAAIDIEKVRTAINTNDYNLALENFEAVLPIILELTAQGGVRYPINANNIEDFMYFVLKVKDNGMKYWFKKEFFKHWCELYNDRNDHIYGFYDFLRYTVRKEREKSTVVDKVVG